MNAVKKQHIIRIVKVCGITLAVYAILVVLFYFICGEQLHFRNSRGNIDMGETERFPVGLTQGTSVSQTFVPQIDKINSFAVRWGNYERENSGELTMEVFRADNHTLLAKQTFAVSEIGNGGLTVLNLDTTLDDCRGVMLEIILTSTSADDQCVAPCVNLTDASTYGGEFRINGVLQEGALCLSVSGIDFVWTGQHYWEFAAGGAALVFLVSLIVAIRVNLNKKSLIYETWGSLKRYKFLIHQLVSRDFKTKYKRSFFGILWSFLNPLLTSFVMYIVFSQLFRYEIEFYPVYLISGVILFNFFTECTNMCLTSIVDNANLITKVYVPKLIYPVTRTLSSGINLSLALIPVILIALISRLFPKVSWLLLPYPIFCLMLFGLGVGLLLAAAMVFFRDIRFLWGVATMMWMYLTPIFYPAEILGDRFSWVLQINPMYHIIDFVRTCIINGISPEPRAYVWCILGPLIAFIIGAFVFKKTEDKFIHYL